MTNKNIQKSNLSGWACIGSSTLSVGVLALVEQAVEGVSTVGLKVGESTTRWTYSRFSGRYRMLSFGPTPGFLDGTESSVLLLLPSEVFNFSGRVLRLLKPGPQMLVKGILPVASRHSAMFRISAGLREIRDVLNSHRTKSQVCLAQLQRNH